MKKFLILILLCWQSVFAQTFNYTAPLPRVERNGFYQIPLSPELISLLNENFSNIRLYDSVREIPYLLNSEKPVFTSQKFVEYPIVEKLSKNHFTQIVFANADKKSISNIALVIKNTDATKEATLLGSDDGNNWYALKESFLLAPIQSINQTYEMQIVDFPLSNYSRFKLKINDSTNAPLNILKIGYYETDEVLGNYNTLPSPHFTIDENQNTKKSTLKILFDTLMLVDKMEFEIKAPAFFNRSAVIKKPTVHFSRKGKMTKSNDIIEAIPFNSKQQSVFHLPSAISKEFIVEIENEDNPPLQIASVKSYQLKRHLIAWLEKGKTYSIKIGSSDMPSPSYDIGSLFDEKNQNDLTILNHGSIVAVHSKDKTKKHNWYEDKKLMWAAIILITGILAFMSYKMVKETRQS